MKGIIYKVSNKENDMVYIGATTKTIEERKKDHIQKSSTAKNVKFYNAISTYGVEAFTWEQIDMAVSFNELAEKEKNYILKYNSKEGGFNSDRGGGFEKKVFQYDLKGNLVKSYNSLTKASETVNTSKQSISRACLSTNKLYDNFYWSYIYKEPFKPDTDNRKKVVYQYALNGEYVAEYLSVAEASRQTGFNKTSIAKVCRGERNKCGNYLWVY
ncbi:NUMOD1 domain-containing DNA-binding protein [Tenacibaculum sp. 47A_GOM-205m]|uniref:NUMOD1 domain-containing DNA-binding protein n=1 Tax=Tenacibaculum sp. 47A_GOM-205m TaxID=1380384 RepID=UPI00048F770D|nr:NUMOD1 domain-containing DNA-binding protein [Tenacibaculum sp. 47A_GOM-205m]